MTFIPHPYYLTPDDMATFILSIPKTGWTWEPSKITWHNTGEPTLRQWDHDYSQAVRDGWGANYNHYCQFDQRWHSGPHFVGAPDKSIVLCEPRANGVHASCWNPIAFGVETIGDFRHGSDDPLTGRGLLSMQGSANIIAALCKRMGWEPRKVITFHRGCKRDGHACPGDLVTDDWAIGLVEHRLAELNGAATPQPAAPSVVPPGPVMGSVAWAQARLNAVGCARPPLIIDGDLGVKTKNAIAHFQTVKGIFVNGALTPDTIKALAA